MTAEENEVFVVPYPDNEYVLLLGRLTYSVSYFEWAVLGDLPHIEGLPPELAIENLAGLTTGQIAKQLVKPIVLAKVADPKVKGWLTTAAAHLSAIAISRNGVLHARPATIDGEQRLNRWDPSRKEIYVVDTDRIRAIISDIDSRLREMSDIRLPFNT